MTSKTPTNNWEKIGGVRPLAVALIIFRGFASNFRFHLRKTTAQGLFLLTSTYGELLIRRIDGHVNTISPN